VEHQVESGWGDRRKNIGYSTGSWESQTSKKRGKADLPGREQSNPSIKGKRKIRIYREKDIREKRKTLPKKNNKELSHFIGTRKVVAQRRALTNKNKKKKKTRRGELPSRDKGGRPVDSQ